MWYGITGRGPGIPLLVLHGGPGTPHDYLKILARLSPDRPILFYDQLGCGFSDRPDNQELWQLPRFQQELEIVLEKLAPNGAHIIGHSWGTTLSSAYVLDGGPGAVSLIHISPCFSIPRIIEHVSNLKNQLPDEIKEILTHHETAGTTGDMEYKVASMSYFQEHICRIYPYPEDLLKAFEKRNDQVYTQMWGESEFSITGNLKDFDCSRQLAQITLPALLLCGRYDECTPNTTAWYHERLARSEMVVFEQSSHFISVEEPDRLLAVVRDFLRRIEREG